MEINSAASKAHFDAILDCGASDVFFPSVHEDKTTDIIYQSGSILLTDKSCIYSYAIANYGMLKVTLSKQIFQPLIATGFLTNVLDLYLFYIKKRAYILKKIIDEENPDDWYFATVATCTYRDDKLYHFDDITKFLEPLDSIKAKRSSINMTISKIPYMKNEILKGSGRIFHKHFRIFLNDLQWLHLRTCHTHQDKLKSMVKNNACLGFGVTYDSIKNLELGPCNTCLRSRMHALPLPSSISHRTYEPFEAISCDHIPFSRVINGQTKSYSVRGYTGCILYNDIATDMIWIYLVKAKSEWLTTLKQLTREYGPTANARSVPLKYLKSDFCKELQSTEVTEYFKEKDILLQSSSPYKHGQNAAERKWQYLKSIHTGAMLQNNTPVRYWCYALQYTAQTYRWLPQTGHTLSRNEEFSGEKSDISKCVPFYSHGWAHVSEEEIQAKRRDSGSKKTSAAHAVQCRMLGYAEPYEVPDSTTSTVWVKNSYTCLNLETKTIMCRHDCLWNASEPGALSEVTENTTNSDDNVTTSDEEFDYSLIGMDASPEPTSEWVDTGMDDTILNEVEHPEANSHEHDNDHRSKRKTPQILQKPSNNLEERPKRLKVVTSRLQAYNDARSQKDLRILEKQKGRTAPHTKPVGNPEQSANIAKSDESDNNPMPKTLKEALSGNESSQWKKAWEFEMSRAITKNTWEEIHPNFQTMPFNLGIPDGIKPIKSKFVFRKTIRTDGTIKYRVRLVACGYSQILGKDYDDTYAPTAKYRSLCIILNLAAIFNWDIEGIDVEQAFLESELDKDIYMTLPKDVYCQQDHPDLAVIVKLLRSLYGLKQASELWYKTVKEILIDFKYLCLVHDACVFIKRDLETGKITIVVVYVDDILFIGNNADEIQRILTHVESRVTALTTMGEVTRYIGVEIQRDRKNHTLSLSQQPYIDKIITSNQVNDKSAKPIPMQPQADYNPSEEGIFPPIQKQVGEFRFLADRTRPDIQTAVGILGSNAVKPNKAHLRGVDHLARYVKGSRDLLLTFGGFDDSKVELFCYTDAAHLQDQSTKPRMGYAFFLNLHSGTVYAKSIKSNTVSHSSCESEAKAIDAAAIQTIWLRGFLAELGFTQSHPTIFYTDSASAIDLGELFRVGKNSIHMTMRLNFIHECIENGIISLKYINTDLEVADVLTKLLPVSAHEMHTQCLMKGHYGKTPSSTDLNRRTMVKTELLKNIKHPKFKNKNKAKI